MDDGTGPSLADVKSAMQKNNEEVLQRYFGEIKRHIFEDEKVAKQAILEEDDLASCLLPTDVPFQDVFPAKSTGDGNCFFNSASISIRGDESYANYLRVAVAIELYLHAKEYSTHECIDLALLHPDTSLARRSYETICLTDKGAKYFSDNNDLPNAIKTVAIETCDTKSWSALLHFWALSSVLKRKIWSIYPDVNKAIRPLYHCEIRPINAHDLSTARRPVYIMWSRDGSLDNRSGTIFEPNHFVPLISKRNCVEYFDSDDDLLLSQIDLSMLTGAIEGEPTDGTTNAKQNKQTEIPLQNRHEFEMTDRSADDMKPATTVNKPTEKPFQDRCEVDKETVATEDEPPATTLSDRCKSSETEDTQPRTSLSGCCALDIDTNEIEKTTTRYLLSDHHNVNIDTKATENPLPDGYTVDMETTTIDKVIEPQLSDGCNVDMETTAKINMQTAYQLPDSFAADKVTSAIEDIPPNCCKVDVETTAMEDNSPGTTLPDRHDVYIELSVTEDDHNGTTLPDGCNIDMKTTSIMATIMNVDLPTKRPPDECTINMETTAIKDEETATQLSDRCDVEMETTTIANIQTKNQLPDSCTGDKETYYNLQTTTAKEDIQEPKYTDIDDMFSSCDEIPLAKLSNRQNVAPNETFTSDRTEDKNDSCTTSDELPIQVLIEREKEKISKARKDMSRSVSTLKRTKKKQKTPDKMPKCEQESDVDILTDEYESDIEFQNIIPFSDSSSSDCSDTDIDEEQGVPLKWTKLLKHHGNVEFTGPPSGATEDYSSSLDPLEYFFEIFPKELFPLLTKSTNDYVPIYRDRQRKLKNDPYWSDAKYKVITEEDIKAYFGIRILMGINKLPQVLDYWSTNPSMRNERVASTMSRQKFLTIQRYFHINDPTQDPTRLKDHDVAKKKLERDPLFKVSPLMEAVRENSMTKYNMHQNISVDEAMIKCHGQHSSIVGAPNKPAKRGFKIFVCADAVSGYLWNFQVYLRRKKEVGLTQRVVENLTENVTGRNHVVFVDKFYTSVPLALSLLDKSTHLCGSFNTGRKHWPQDLKITKSVHKKDDKVRMLSRGDHMTRQTKDGKLVATVWKDSKHVFNLSTCFNPITNSRQDTVLRKKVNTEGKWEKSEYSCPPAIVEFNKYMGGVDRHDHLRSNYSVQRSSVRWWTYFLWFAVDISLVNSFIMYKAVNPRATHKRFQRMVAEQLIGGYSSRIRKSKQTSAIGVLDREFAVSHELTTIPGRTRACRYCSITKQKTTGGQRTRTSSFGCVQCRVSLHRECFLPYHDIASRKGRMEDKSTQTSAPETPKKEKTTPGSRDPGSRKRRLDHSVTDTPLRRSPRKLAATKRRK